MVSYTTQNAAKNTINKSYVRSLLQQLSGPYWLMGALLYSGGLRPLQCVSLRVADLDLIAQRLHIRQQRSVVLAPQLIPHLKLHLSRQRTRHLKALAQGDGWVALPASPQLSRQWSEQYVFPAAGFGLTPDGLKFKQPFPEARLISAVGCVAQSLCPAAGDPAISAFDLRRALALHLVESGCPVPSMKHYLGLAQEAAAPERGEFSELVLQRVFKEIFSSRLLGQHPHPDFVSEPAALYRIAS